MHVDYPLDLLSFFLLVQMWWENTGLRRMFYWLSESPNSYSPASRWIWFTFFAVVHFCLTKRQRFKSGSMNLMLKQSCEWKMFSQTMRISNWWVKAESWLFRLYCLFSVLRKKFKKLCTIFAVSSNFVIHLQWSQRKAAKGIDFIQREVFSLMF